MDDAIEPPSHYPSEHWSSLIGIVTAIVGNVLISAALNTQRYAHMRLEQDAAAYGRGRGGVEEGGSGSLGEEEEYGEEEGAPLLGSRGAGARRKQKSYLSSPYWWSGIVLMTIGEAGNFLAYGFAPASIVSPLGVVALISNCVIAPIMLKERFRWRDAAGVVVAVGGAVTVVLSASSDNPKLGPEEIWGLMTRWEFEVYVGVTVGVIAVLMWASNHYGEKNILVDLGLVGLFGGYTALSTKGVASLLSYTLWRVITFPVFYALLAILVGTAIMQIKYVNRALQRFSATQVIPVQFVLFTLSVILGSAVLYRDFERTSGDHAGKFVGGCAMTFLGVWLITSGRRRQSSSTDSDTDSDPATPSSTRRPMTPTNRPQTPTIKLTATATPLSPTSTSTSTTTLVAHHQKPGFPRHTSVPVLPSEAAPPFAPVPATSSPPRTPPRRHPSESSALLSPTPRDRGRDYTRDETPRRLRSTVRVGPLLASPLSASLSAVVQDLKRGGGERGRRGSALGLGAGGEAVGVGSGAAGPGPGAGEVVWSVWQDGGSDAHVQSGAGVGEAGTLGEPFQLTTPATSTAPTTPAHHERPRHGRSLSSLGGFFRFSSARDEEGG